MVRLDGHGHRGGQRQEEEGEGEERPGLPPQEDEGAREARPGLRPHPNLRHPGHAQPLGPAHAALVRGIQRLAQLPRGRGLRGGHSRPPHGGRPRRDRDGGGRHPRHLRRREEEEAAARRGAALDCRPRGAPGSSWSGGPRRRPSPPPSPPTPGSGPRRGRTSWSPSSTCPLWE